MDSTQLDPVRPNKRPPPESAARLHSIGGYRLLRLLGTGGMGAVYLGYDEKEQRQVAVKVLADDLIHSQHFVDRFYREGRVGQLLHHPNIVRALQCGQDERTGKHYLALEFIDGRNTSDLLIVDGQLGIGDAVHIALDVSRALEHTHARNIIHRDIKPDNLLLTTSGVCKLADFGLAKLTNEVSHLTGTRQVFGTTLYMPYEQAINARYADGRSDIYALGATLYQLVAGQAPFQGADHLEIIEKKSIGKYEPASVFNPAIPMVLEGILAKMLARLPRDRYQTASELIIDLERSRLAASIPSFADPESVRKDPWVRACLETANEATRPALPPVEVPSSPPPRVKVWLVRYMSAAGELKRFRLTRQQIIQGVRSGKLPCDVEVCRRRNEGFHSLDYFPSFRVLRQPSEYAHPGEANEENGSPPSPPWPRGRWLLLGGFILVAAVALLAWYSFSSGN
jgi:serine/threonine-protein kinase